MHTEQGSESAEVLSVAVDRMMDRAEAEVAREESAKWKDLREVEDRHSLITLAYCKGDADGMVLDTDENGDDVLCDLTDDEWEEVRARFDRGADHIREMCWGFLEDLAREVIGER